MAGAGTDTAATGRRSPQPQPRGPLCARCGRGESSGGCDVADDAGDLDSAKHLPLQGATAPPSSAPRQSPGRWTPLGAGSLEAQRGHDGGQPQQPPNGHYYYCAVTPGIHPSTYVDPSASSPSFASAPCRPSTSVDLSHLSSPVAVCTDDGSYFSDPACLAHRGPLSLPRALSSSSSSSSCSTSTSSSRSRHSKHKQRRRDNDAQLCRLRPKLPSLKAMARRESLSELRAANPELALSGNIISATFNLPHALTYRRDGDWELKPRRGQSALFDSFSYLSSDATSWRHTVVAWTGEIESPHDAAVSSTPDAARPTTTVGLASLNALSAPVPVDVDANGHARAPTPAPSDGLFIPREDQVRLEERLAGSKTIRTIPVWLADDTDASPDGGVTLRDQARWHRYAQHDLCTLFHYKQHEPSDGRRERLYWADYYRMNQMFANRIIEAYKPGDIVIVHDYFLMLLPSMLRQRVPGMYISFFLHCPFPSSEFVRCLPRRKEILEGVLGANLIGFQSYSYSRHFLSCCTRILGFPSDTLGIDAYGSRVHVGVFPIGIDAAKVEAFAWADSVTEKYNALRKLYAGKKIIVGRDRLDSVRGVVQKLQAFERFLETYPEWRERAVLIQVTSPTTAAEGDREDPENRVGSRVNELVMKINGQYGSLGFSPVQHYPQYLDQDEYFALLRAADIGLITSVRDGMNTTSLEYVVCQKDGHGPLILSEFSGTAGSLGDAMHINPWDLGGVADKINAALTASPEQRAATQRSLYQHVTTHNAQAWIGKFIRKVHSVLGDAGAAHTTPLLDCAVLLSQYRSAGKRLFMFDYDGTLTPIVREPSAAIPSRRIIRSLQLLAADAKNSVWIISGRDQEFLNQHLGHIQQLGFSAEHGSFMRHPGTEEWVNLADKFDMSWQAEVIKVFEKYTDKVSGTFIERKRCALTWHYRLADPEQGLHMSRECHKELEAGVARTWDVEVMPGKANIEVRPTFINKGEIAKRLIATYHNPRARPTADDANPGRVEFALCVGDDFTDEDMFRSLNGASGPVLNADHVFTVTVGASTKVTLAKWHLLEPEDVIECVALLAGADGPDRMGEVNLGALSSVEGHLPAEER